jgi:hypothetical protein
MCARKSGIIFASVASRNAPFAPAMISIANQART